MDFEYFWEKQRKLESGEPKYISLCKIFQGSGEDKIVINKIFDKYMIISKDYDKDERAEMIRYLCIISKDINV